MNRPARKGGAASAGRSAGSAAGRVEGTGRTGPESAGSPLGFITASSLPRGPGLRPGAGPGAGTPPGSGPGARPAEAAPRKRLFIGLVAGTSILLCLLLLVGWIIPAVGFGNIHPSVPYITGALLVLCILVIAWAAAGLVLQILTGRRFWGSDRVRGLTIKFFLPFMELLARLVGVGPREVRRSFIKVNNELTESRHRAYPPEKILLLLPHCLQHVDCSIRLTARAEACARCGRCPMAGLLEICERRGIRPAVATGGSIARRIVVETRPALILAVACERDLASGIQDTHPLPVFGILNDRPEGPCRNTLVDLALVDAALDRFIAPQAAKPSSAPAPISAPAPSSAPIAAPETPFSENQ